MIDIKVEELKRKMVQKGVSKRVLARKLWIRRKALMKILAGQIEFTWRQIRKIAEMLSLNNDEIMLIFFDKKFPKGNKKEVKNEDYASLD